MARVESTITINAPVEKVFGYIDERANLTAIWPSMMQVSDIQALPNGGKSFRFQYKMAGMRFGGTSEDVEYAPNERVVSRTKGGIQSTLTWTYEPKDGGTRVTVVVEYTVPVPLLGRLAEAVVVKQNERESELILANLKAAVES